MCHCKKTDSNNKSYAKTQALAQSKFSRDLYLGYASFYRVKFTPPPKTTLVTKDVFCSLVPKLKSKSSMCQPVREAINSEEKKDFL